MNCGAVVFLSTYVFYYFTLYPSIPGGDSGELLAEACHLGVAHPPGYPTYTLLSHFVMNLPHVRITPFDIDMNPSPAWKINHLCCVFGALAASLIAMSIKQLTSPRNHIGIILPAYLFAFSSITWEYSVGAEVFATNNALCAAMLYLTSVIISRQSTYAGTSNRLLLIGALLSGIAMTNQHSCLLLLIVLLPYLVVSHRQHPVLLLYCAVACCLGLSPYAYLFCTNPARGSWGNTSTIDGLLHHILRSEYGTFQLGILKGHETSLQRIVIYLQHVIKDGFGVTLVFAVVAFYATIRDLLQQPKTVPIVGKGKKSKEKVVEAVTLSPISTAILVVTATWIVYVLIWHCVLSNLPLSHPMPFAVHSRFWMQPNISLCILAGVGIHRVMEHRSISMSSVTHYTLIAIFLSALVAYRYPHMRRDNGTLLRDYGTGILTSLPENAILLSHSDMQWNTVRYLQACEGVRPDVTHLNFQLMPYPWFPIKQAPFYDTISFPPLLPGVSTTRGSQGNAQLIHRFLTANLPRHSDIFLEMQAITDPEIDTGSRWHGLTLLPYGPVYKVLAVNNISETFALHNISLQLYQVWHEQYNLSLLADKNMFVNQFPPGTWEFGVVSVINDGYYQLGLMLLTSAMEMQKESTAVTFILPLLDRYVASTDILTTLYSSLAKYGPLLSVPVADLRKNTALAYMRTVMVLEIVVKYRVAFKDIADKISRKDQNLFISDAFIENFQDIDQFVLRKRKDAKEFIMHYLELANHTLDNDVRAFKKFVDSLN